MTAAHTGCTICGISVNVVSCRVRSSDKKWFRWPPVSSPCATMASTPRASSQSASPHRSGQLLAPTNGFAQPLGLLFLSFLKLPPNGLDFSFGAPPFDPVHMPSIRLPSESQTRTPCRPSVSDHRAQWFWKSSRAIRSKRFHIFPEQDLRPTESSPQAQFGAHCSAIGTTDTNQSAY